MGRAGRWLRNFLTGKRSEAQKDMEQQPWPFSPPPQVLPVTTPPPPKDKKKWTFRRSAVCVSKFRLPDVEPSRALTPSESRQDQKQQPAVAAMAGSLLPRELAAVKIQSSFRAFLARKALCALRGLVKLQALVRGHLVRRQARATLRCMEALMTAQARIRAERMQMMENSQLSAIRKHAGRRSPQNSGLRRSYVSEDGVIGVDMESGSRGNGTRSRNSCYVPAGEEYSRSPAPSAFHYSSSSQIEEFTFATAQSGMMAGYPFCPNYMANTESSKAKARSQSAPKQRTDGIDRQSSRRKNTAAMIGRNVPRSIRMQRSTSNASVAAINFEYPWLMKLDRSSASVRDSECGSMSSLLTNRNYCRSVA